MKMEVHCSLKINLGNVYGRLFTQYVFSNSATVSDKLITSSLVHIAVHNLQFWNRMTSKGL